jgi:DNA-binding transcriptional LysR family regulator
MDRIAAMNVFVRVVEAGTFTKAAETLDLPNATVTRLIQGLEQDLKVRLLHRTTRSLTVTPEGAAYFERVRRLLDDLDELESSTRQSHARPSGKVRVESASAISASVLLPALDEFREAFPDVEIELGVGNKYADLIADGIDCAIRAGEVDEQSMVARRIGSFEFTTCATPAFMRTRAAPRSPGDLAQLPTIGMVTARGGRPSPFRYSNDGSVTELALNHALVVNDANMYITAGMAGLGIVQAPSYAVHRAIEDGRLVRLLEDWRTPAMPLHIVYPPNRYLSAKVRVFIDWVVTLFERNPCTRRG